MRRYPSMLIAVVIASSISALPVRAVPSVGQLTAIAAAPDVFTEDGAVDLVVGYRDRNAGAIAVLPGNPLAQLGVDGTPLRHALPQTSIPVAAELIATGDFDNDGHRDVVATAIGASAFYLLRGDGAGRLANPREFDVDGHVTAIASGEVNRTDGLAELVVGVDGANGSACLEYEGPDGALNASPEIIALPSPPLSIAIGHAVGPVLGDIALACGAEAVVIEGRDRCLLAGEEGARGVAAPKLHTTPVDNESATPIVGVPDVHHDPRAIRVRLNGDAIDDFVVVDGRSAEPAVVLSEPASTFTVTSTDDSGPGTLRQAITDANASEGPDRIAFSIGYGDAAIITLQSPLPAITDPVTVDGFTTATPGGRSAPAVTLAGSEGARVGLEIAAGNSVVRGIAFQQFVYGDDFVGGAGILLRTAGGNRIESCLFGSLDPDADDLGNNYGIRIEDSAGNTIGGAVPAAANIAVGNYNCGVQVLGPDNVLTGNIFGADSSFTIVNANGNGVVVDNAPRNRVGGTLPGEANYAFSNYQYGIDVISIDAAENLVQGNVIGLDPSGKVAGYNTYGVGVCGGAENGAMANFIGGTATGAGNLITNGGIGVAIGTAPDSTAIENRVLCNTIFGNSNIGIDLADDTYSYNDPMDADGGPNSQQNAPVLSDSHIDGDQLVISGTISTTPGASLRLEFFSGSTFSELGFGGGGKFVGSGNVTTDGSGVAAFEIGVPLANVTGPSLSATATTAAGNSSEFSLAVALNLAWDAPDPNSGPNAPPRNPRVSIPGAGKLEAAPAPPGVTGYNVYRGKTPGFTAGASSLYRGNVPTSAIGSFAFPSGSFFRITAIYPGGESAPTDAVGGGVPPSITSTLVKKGKLLVDGSGFVTGAFALLDGIPFGQPAKLKRTDTRVVQKGALIIGDSINSWIGRNAGVSTVMIRNPDGGTALRRVTR